MDDHLTQNTGRMQRQHLQNKTSNFSHAEFPPGMENTPAFLGKQFLQGKEKITCPDMENIPALLWNQSIQGNEKNVDTCTFIPGSTTPSRHSMLSIPTHSRKVPQNFQQLEKESSNTVALPGFNHNVKATTHVETSSNVHSNGTLSTSLKTDTNMNANMDTNHTAHRYRHTRKEVHLLSEPAELQPLKAMAHQYTGKEVHLLSGPSELQPTEDSETQKFDSAHIQHPRQEYSRLTETNKAKFQDPFIYNDDRNFVRHNSVSKISPNLVFMTTPNTSSVSNSVLSERKEENVEDAEIAEIVEDAAEGPAPAPTAEGPVPAPAPAPAATLEIVHERPHSKSKEKSMENFGRPASTYSDFYIWRLFQPGLADTRYNVLTFCKTCKYSHICFFALSHTRRAVIQLISRPGIQSYRLTSFRTNNLRTH